MMSCLCARPPCPIGSTTRAFGTTDVGDKGFVVKSEGSARLLRVQRVADTTTHGTCVLSHTAVAICLLSGCAPRGHSYLHVSGV
jgi:hypothetical protein